MKKVRKSTSPPEELVDFIARNPIGAHGHTWRAFDDERSAKRVVQHRLFHDQKGLCAYCEIDLTFTQNNQGGEAPKGDLRIEHFHPKSDTSRNWAFDWNNMLAVCTGGDERALMDEARIAVGKRDHHCDSPKGEKNLDGVILNPLTDIPAFPSLFEEDPIRNTSEELYLRPNANACEAVGSDCLEKARRTLEELHLNCRLLAQLRRRSVGKWIDSITGFVGKGMSYDDAIEEVMRIAFDPDAETWPPFFSTVRAHFGVAAEKRLRFIQYDG